MSSKWRSTLVALYVFLGVILLSLGIATGIAIAAVRNTDALTGLNQEESALPSQLLDRHGRLITEFFSEENRDLVAFDELPRHLIYALITREDHTFFRHSGFSVRGTTRAAWNILTNDFVSGGSTLTQQLAGHLYADRSEFSIRRKLVELWWALQLERELTKEEILEAYLNRMWFGHGNYGVEAASQFFFGHSARELTVAESAMLVIQLANPSLYSPIRRPNEAGRMQGIVVDQMVAHGYVTREEADASLAQYWRDYDFTRANTETAFYEREDRAPYFSEYVRFQLENQYLLGTLDINRDGFVIHTTLDLAFQEHAQRLMRDGIASANRVYSANTSVRSNYGDDLVPVIELLSLAFDIDNIRVGDAKQRQGARQTFEQEINPVLDIVNMVFGGEASDGLTRVTRASYSREHDQAQRTTVEGALISLENDTGHIVAMVGGREFEARNQFNRAVNAAIEPGSSFKPLYYAAAIEAGVLTPATMIYDSPFIFRNDDGTPYAPENYRGEWAGPVLARTALSRSMNVPSLRVLDMVGFTRALDTAAGLLGIPSDQMSSRNLVRRYPVGLGIVETAPIEMARAYATFANQGRAVTPVSIRRIEDREGRIVVEPEAEQRRAEQRNGGAEQIVSETTAYVITDMLETTVSQGTLGYARRLVDGFDQPTAGKTGTTQNWADAWTVGYTPYYTTAVWFGFDRGGANSLGVNQTGAVTAGPVWARYMDAVHEGLPEREFVRPEGVVDVRVTAQTGLLPPAGYRGRIISELFVAGTQPTEFDTLEQFTREQETILVGRLSDALDGNPFSLTSDDIPPVLDLSLDTEGLTIDGLNQDPFDLQTEFGLDDDLDFNPLLD